MHIISANEQPIELRGFGKLSAVFKERGWPSPQQVQLPGPLTGYSLLRMLELDEYLVEVVFINGKAHSSEDVIHPGDRVSLVPPGTPGPHRMLLGFIAKK